MPSIAVHALLLALLAGGGPASPPSGISLLVSGLGTLDERMTTDAEDIYVAQLVVPGLFTVDDHGKVVPDLAQRFRILTPLTLDVILRSGLTFHDGSKLTSADVKATLEGLKDPSLGSPRSPHFEAIDSVEAVDERTVRIHLKRPYAPILAELTIGIVPASRARKPASGEQAHGPIGAGPFRLASWSDPAHVELEPFAGYYGGRPAISRVHVHVVSDERAQVQEVMAGHADLVAWVSPSAREAMRQTPGVAVLARPGTDFAYLYFNLRSGPTADVRVRRAICQAIDVNEIIRSKFHGLAVPATGMLPREHWAYAPAEGCHRDLAAAGALLDQAGFPKDAQGKRALALTYKTSQDPFRVEVALALKAQMEALGIQVGVQSLAFRTLMDDLGHGRFEMGTMVQPVVYEPDLMRQFFSSAFVPSERNDSGTFNRMGYQNPEADALLEAATAGTQDERRARYARILAILDRDLPILPLWHEQVVYIASPRLAGFKPSAHGFLTPLARAREVAR
jgi:peptide/nickel transport system substrate-binding protein